MDLSKMTVEEARAIVLQAQNVFDASIADQQRTSPKEIQDLPLDLSVAKPRSQALKISFPFKSLWVEQATDINTYVYVIPISNDTGNTPIRMGLKDVFKSEYGFRECFIYWDAQPSKQIILKFFVRSIVENGRLVLDQNSQFSTFEVGGGSAQNDGFTVICRAEFNALGATGTFDDETYAKVEGISSQAFNTGTYYDSSSNAFKTFQVPMGYTAEVIGIETVFNSAMTSASVRNQIFEGTDQMTYEPATQYVSSNHNGLERLSIGRSYAQNFTPTKAYNFLIFQNSSGLRSDRKFKEGKLIMFLSRTNTNSGAQAVIQNEYFILIRLTKNVG